MVVEMTKSCLSKSQFTLGLQLSKLMKTSPVYVTQCAQFVFQESLKSNLTSYECFYQ